MTVKQLREALEKYPDDMDVFLDERLTDYTYGLVNSVCQMEIDMIDEETEPAEVVLEFAETHEYKAFFSSKKSNA